MGPFINKAVQLLSKNWKKLAKPIGYVASLLTAARIGAFLARRKTEKEKARLIKVIRKHDARIQALESKNKQSFKDKLQIKKLESENAMYRAQLASLEETPQNA